MENEDASDLENVIRGDITDPDTLNIPDVDMIIHCAGILESSHPTDEMMMRVNFNGTENIFNSGLSKGMKEFIFISTVSVLGPHGTKDKPMTESMEPSPADIYGKSKWKAEEFLTKASKDNNVKVTILRPTVLYGPGMNLNSSGMKTFTAIRKGIMPLVGDGANILNMLYVDNLVEAIFLSMGSSRYSRIYNVSEGPYTQKTVIDAIEKRMDKKGHKRYPKPLLWMMTFFSELSSPLFKGPPLLSWTKYHGLTTSNWNLSSDLIRKELGFKEIVSLEEGVGTTCDHYNW
jgi:nucleoside-diphosphate-sugar epimerase